MNRLFLLIDDDPVMLFLHERLLIKTGRNFNIKSFSNGRLALDFIESSARQNFLYHLFLDINMPVMNGWEFLENIQHSTALPNLNIAVVSSAVEEVCRTKSLSFKGVIGYYPKPLTPGILEEILAAMLE